MDVTRRFWGMAGVGGLLLALAVVANRPLLLLGGAGVGAVLLARQYAFLRTIRRIDDSLQVELMATRTYLHRDEETDLTVTASLAADSPLSLSIETALPVIAGAVPRSQRRFRIEAGETGGETTFSVAWPAVGTATIEPPSVTVTSQFGLFSERIQRGDGISITVEPPHPRNVHVGEGGDAVLTSFGGERTGQYGTGTDPAEIREYAPGDSVANIDWKATARLAYPHVRDYEVESDRQTILVVDHRPSLADGPDGETKLDYLREVALSVTAATRDGGDPLGIYAIGEGGVTREQMASTDTEQYREINAILHDLTADVGPTSARQVGRGVAPTRRKRQLLADDDTAFGQTLEPFVSEGGYVRRLSDDPLFETVRRHVTHRESGQWLFLFTDDSDRGRLREAVKLAQREQHNVSVFIAPGPLFRSDGLADLDSAYEAYADFEEFRRELASLDRVTAYEVGPGDRLEALLSARAQRR